MVCFNMEMVGLPSVTYKYAMAIHAACFDRVTNRSIFKLLLEKTGVSYLELIL